MPREIELYFVFKVRPRDSVGPKVSGGYVGGVTPVLIPNTEVKPSRADGTARETVWESRTLPDLILKGLDAMHRGPSPLRASARLVSGRHWPGAPTNPISRPAGRQHGDRALGTVGLLCPD